MNKRSARARAVDGSLTFGDLRELIKSARGRGGMSRVNKAVPLEAALDLYRHAIDREAGEATVPVYQMYAHRLGRTKASLIAENILRDCG